jgi:hypothetical protein
MASQIAHIVYAKRYFERLESGELFSRLTEEEKEKYPLGKIDKDEFILGTTFPDIRLIDENIKRRDTHLRFDPLNLDFSTLSPFEAGWKFHLYCDMKREEVLNKYNFYSLPHASDLANRPAKFLEDELIYSSYNNWEKVCNFFNNPPYIDASIGISPESFKLWYAILARYMSKNPDNRSIRSVIVKLPPISNKMDEIMASIEKLRENKKAIEILRKVKEEIV